jgi:AcrR family transcriptional regulator
MGTWSLGARGRPRGRSGAVPTGVRLVAADEQLFDAAERVLLRDGPNGLTSRAVTAEAGVAKGVLHRHFADFDAFLTEFALHRIALIGAHAAALRESAGTGTVPGNLAAALTGQLGPVEAALVGLVISRDELRARLRGAGAGRVPVAVEATAMIASYLTAERDLGRIRADADIAALAPALTGTWHLMFAGLEGTPPGPDEVRKAVTAVIAGAVPETRGD